MIINYHTTLALRQHSVADCHITFILTVKLQKTRTCRLSVVVLAVLRHVEADRFAVEQLTA